MNILRHLRNHPDEALSIADEDAAAFVRDLGLSEAFAPLHEVNEQGMAEALASGPNVQLCAFDGCKTHAIIACLFRGCRVGENGYAVRCLPRSAFKDSSSHDFLSGLQSTYTSAGLRVIIRHLPNRN